MLALDICCGVMTVIEVGTSCARSSRRCAVTITSAMPLSAGVLAAFGNGSGFSGTGMTSSGAGVRSEEHTSELQSLMRISYAVFCLKKKKILIENNTYNT